MSTLFERIGGDDAIDVAVERFYDRVLQDERIRHFFAGVDMERQRGHQKKFLKFAFGGAPGYSGRSMAAAHAHLVANMGLNDNHFDAVVENLATVLGDLGVRDGEIGEVAAIAESIRGAVLGRA
jgi:hemoglobin